MASQYGTTRKYTSVTEGESKPTVQCPVCKVLTTPRGLASTTYQSISGGDRICASCGKNLTRTWSKIT